MRLAALALLLAAAGTALRADEGMWTFDNVPVKQIQAKYGFSPDAAWLRRLQLATVRFPGGTGAFVSPDGLVITNHHVGRDVIAQLSSATADHVRDGFVAADRARELKAPGLELMELVSTEDVTARVAAAIQPGMDDAAALAARRQALAAIRKAEEAATGLVCEPVTLYQGGEYWIYRYRTFKDVRLVAAPELQVAAFGGDPDNYTWPRHNLDFSLFRVYVDGKPYRPEAWLPFSPKGVSIGDLTFISGHPGITYRQFTLAQMTFARDAGIPFQLRLLERQRAALQAYAATSPEAARLAATPIYGLGNAIKRLSGQLLGLAKPANLEKVAEAEAALKAAVAKDPALRARAGDSWDRIAQAVARQQTLQAEAALVSPGRVALLGHALTLVRLASEPSRPAAERLPEFAEGNLKATRERLLSPRPVEKPIDAVLLAADLQAARDLLGAEHPFVKAMLGGASPEAVAQAAVAGTRLDDPAERRRLADGGAAALAASDDPMIRLARILDPFQRSVRKRMETEVTGVLNEQGGRLAEARFKAFGKSLYPDATFTLRLGYGTVSTYANGCGTLAQPFTTFMGMYDRYAGWGGNARAAEGGAWTLPQRWLDRERTLDLATPFDFIYSCDTVGGNSGSPVVNTKGEFVGINFDSVYEGQGGYYVYDPDTKRAVATDARAILEALRKVMDAGSLADELLGK